jgi:hypothetical protein
VTAQLRSLADLVAAAVFALLLAVVFPAGAAAQVQAGDTTHKGTSKDLPLTAAQRQAFVGSYAVTLPYGERRSFRIFEENGTLKAQTDEDPGSRRLLYQGDNIFHPAGMPHFAFTFVLQGGLATSFTVQREDGVMKGTRIP